MKQRILAVDTETTGLDVAASDFEATYVSYWTNSGKGAAFPWEDPRHAKLQEALANEDVTKLIFNAKYDLRVFHKYGIQVNGPVIDVLLLAQLLLPDEKVKKLKHLVRKFLKDPYLEEIALNKWKRQNRGVPIGKAPLHILNPYNLADSRRLFELFVYLSAGIDQYNLWAVVEREMLLMQQVVMPMEDYGMAIDLQEVTRLQIAVNAEIVTLRKKMLKVTGNPTFNPNSPKQLLKALQDEKVFYPTRWSLKTGNPKTDVVSLLQTPSELASLVLQHRKIAKAGSTYLDHFNRSVIHATFNQNGARTGRFSSSEPNLQNIPRPKEDNLLGRMRACFTAREKRRLLFADYKQLQLRLAAHFSGEKHMIAAIRSGEDLHDKTCMQLFEITPSDKQWELLRYLAKTLNFSMLFGAGADKICLTVLKDTNGKIRVSLQDMANYVQRWKAKHPAIMKLFDDVHREVAMTGGVVNFYGRFMPVDRMKPYVGVNYKIQGTEADFMKLVMLRLGTLLADYKTSLCLQAHDELGFDWFADEKHIVKDIKRIMEDHKAFKVPLICSFSYGKNWFAKKKLEV